MRYIGNKTKLLGFIGSVLDSLDLQRGSAADPFAGTASVAQYLKQRGFAVHSSDIMSYSYVLQRAYVQLDHLPTFQRLLQEDVELSRVLTQPSFQAAFESRFHTQRDLFGKSGGDGRGPSRSVILYLDKFLSPLSSFITREYSAETDSAEGRRFFTRSNGQRIDAIRTQLDEWREAQLVTDDEFHLLLACLLEAADSVANTTGVYAAFVKSWQSNALRPLRLHEPDLVVDTGLDCVAHQEDANALVRTLGPLDLLYLDPPYNTRQYSAYYHVPEVIAQGWFNGIPELRGKTGLIPNEHKKSNWSITTECVSEFHDLVGSADARFVLLSYNNEGIIPPEAIQDALRMVGRPDTLRVHTMEYGRYRSDRDHEQRVYKGDVVTEYLYSVELEPSSQRPTRCFRSRVPS